MVRINIGGKEIEQVKEFYLGSVITTDAKCHREIRKTPPPIHMHPPEPDPLPPPCGRHKFLSSIRDLGVTLDSSLTFSDHTSNLTRSYFHLSRLRAIRKSVSISVFTFIVHAFVCSPIDYCNSLLIGLPKCNY